ncbi:hypothetical protein GQ44DRAFT_744976 [Phaeosphaeriaceae sp. PMI808]|nr:hypothetical protein GQ44DRAFT_744976 [Phaeosphaeriaceae sp. PMI808]
MPRITLIFCLYPHSNEARVRIYTLVHNIQYACGSNHPPAHTRRRRYLHTNLVGNVAVRREIRDLKKDHPLQWTFYMLALARLQWLSQDDPLSYYGLASIHGRPYRTWGDAPGLQHKVGTASYCPHNNALFLGWHRPYLALFEEQLYKHVQDFAKDIAPKNLTTNYTAAANSFRMPYWDWARGEDGGPIPDFFTMRKINLTYPGGFVETIYNPLYAFYFHPLTPEAFDGKWRNLKSTQRWPSSDDANSKSNDSAILQAYMGNQRGLLDNINRSFRKATINEFGRMVEETHGWVHGVIGGGWDSKSSAGHMWPLEYSAFEPLFMLHHTNVDRLFAMYQASHPERNFIPESVGPNGNVFLENDQIVDSNTRLLPFRKRTGGFWTTKDAWRTETFGYAYAETFRKGNTTDTEQKYIVDKAIANLYSPSARRMLTNQVPSVLGAGSTLPASNGTTTLPGNGTFTDWTIGTYADARNQYSTFVVRFTLVANDVAVDVGSWVNLMPESHTRRLPCDTNTEHKNAAATHTGSVGSVSLTATLLDQVARGKLASLGKTHVIPYLKESLSWIVLSGNGTQIPTKDVDAFTFEVVSTQARIPKDPDLPVEYSDEVARYPEITRGRYGGAKG